MRKIPIKRAKDEGEFRFYIGFPSYNPIRQSELKIFWRPASARNYEYWFVRAKQDWAEYDRYLVKRSAYWKQQLDESLAYSEATSQPWPNFGPFVNKVVNFVRKFS